MNYIILDLEWNQCPTGKQNEDPKLPFEIIEIGAIRVDREHGISDAQFREVVKPQVYLSLHSATREIVSLCSADFEQARFFPEVISDFLDWCGDDPTFCTWGPADLTELQRNMAYYGISSPFPFPLLYFDLQKIFSIVFEDRKTRRSLEYAVDYLRIPKQIPFHSALSDAFYTAQIMKQIDDEQIVCNSSVDYFRTPKSRRQEIYIQYPTYSKFVSKPFDSKILAMKDRTLTTTTCYLCHRNIPKKIRWFAIGGSNYCCLAYCNRHGYLKGKIRLRHREDERFFAIKTQKLISEEDAYLVREKKEIQKLKRRLRKEFNRSKSSAQP
jgi:inhibitor of KinA sporulation pathway (predicted exonuclease)